MIVPVLLSLLGLLLGLLKWGMFSFFLFVSPSILLSMVVQEIVVILVH